MQASSQAQRRASLARRALTWRPFGRWARLKLAKREVLARVLLSTAPLVLAVVSFSSTVMSSRPIDGADDFAGTAVWLFVAWRFARLGLYTSRWGVRVCNPLLTYWYPWRKVAHFAIVPGAEAFLPKSEIVAVVTTRGRERPIFALSSGVAFFRLTKDRQAEILDYLNGLATPSKIHTT